MYSITRRSKDKVSRSVAGSTGHKSTAVANFDDLIRDRYSVSDSQSKGTVQREVTGTSDLAEFKSNEQYPDWIKTKIDEVVKLGENAKTEVEIDSLSAGLQLLQYNIEYWRDTTSSEDWPGISKSWKSLHSTVVELVNRCAEEKNKVNRAATGLTLATNYEPALVSLAMRITVTNASHVTASEFSKERNVKRSQQGGVDELPERQGLAPNLGGDTPESLKRKAVKLDKKGAGVCSEFAAAAASMLTGKGVRVEIMGTSVGAHNYVVVGRPAGTSGTKQDQWQGDTCIVDCWWGAMRWGGYGKPYPQVIWDPASHMAMGNVPNAILYDSATPGGSGTNPLLEAMAKLKKTSTEE